ncbi:SH3 domain-containing protein [Chelativorans salis]|uniref:SH3 domain-containing protein n=1 Tax=Chelativorans salis TaxID=2978478 RepID=A0ABT2LTC7_9HYPH|nr:SH3 domain-containing protein [Chelativorans sp. EGI FJ00035]MCT7377309.1 SH3 domain-containing protein [Chelativorans sp. EGI FJ00035]
MKASWLFAAFAFLGAAGGPQAASAADAFTITDVNMRAGPSTRFPRITTLPAGVATTVYGCTRSWDWCDTGWRGLRGWVSAHYLESLYDDRRVIVPDYGRTIGLPIITFEFGTYWDRWYRDRPWYRERDRWRREWRSGWAAEIEPERTYRAIEMEPHRRDVPPGIRKKGPDFCPPGQQKKGRC